MNPPKCQAEDYMQWLIASPKVISCTQAAKASQLAAHDAYTRLLERLEPNSGVVGSKTLCGHVGRVARCG